MTEKIVVVGAGLAGLHAAHLLRKRGLEIVVLEARDRIGGRILSVGADGRDSDDGFDLGPSWFWPHVQPELAALVRELGLRTFVQHSEGDVVFERMSRESPQRYRPVAQEQQSFRLAGGSAALVRALARTLPAESVKLGARVRALKLVSAHVELEVVRDGAVEVVAASRVLAAVPPRMLEAGVAFDPPQDEAARALWRRTPTWMAPHAKFFALYDRPFWRDAGLSGTAQSMVGPMMEMHDATTASDQAALFGFLGVGAEQRAALGSEALKRACVAQLTRIFGAGASHPRATLLKDWAADPHTATPADRVPAPMHSNDAHWVAEPWRGKLFMAGSETSSSEPGYLAGAVAAARRAVEEAFG